MSRTGGGSRTGASPARRATSGARRKPTARDRGWVGPALLLAKVAGATAAVALVAFGLLYLRLLNGPISLNFLAQPIERGIAEELAGASVRIEDVAVRLSDTGFIEFELRNVRVTDASNAPLAVAPSAAVALSRKALLRGHIAAESIELISPRLLLFYSDDGTLSVKFSPPAEGADGERIRTPALRGAVDTRPAAAGDGDGTLGRIDLVKVLSEASARARRREHAGFYLREIGLRSATVTLDNGGRKSIWRVPELNLDLDHRRSRSSIAGRAKVESLTGPWDLNFRTYEQESSKTLNLAVSLQGLVPRGLARTLPHLAVLESFDLPVWAEAKLELSNLGEILGGKIEIDAAPGRVFLPWLAANPIGVDGAHLELAYSNSARRFDIASSTLILGDSRVQFSGNAVHAAQGPEGPGWNFDLRSSEGWIAGEPPVLQRLPIEQLQARGFLAPERGRVVVSQFLLRTAGAEVSANGDVSDMGGAMKTRLEGKIGAMPAGVFKTLWPRAVSPQARSWVLQRLVNGSLQGGSFKIATGVPQAAAAGGAWSPVGTGDRVSLALEGSNVEFALLDGWPALEIPRALLRLENKALEISAPDASFAAPDGRRLALKGTLSVDLNEPLPRTGHIAVRGQGPLSLALEMLDHEPLRVLHNGGYTLAGIDGKIEGQLTASLPLGQKLQPTDIKVEGKVRVSDGRAKQAFGPHDIHGANIAVDMTQAAVDIKGEMLVKGVPARISWQHVYGAPPEKQPPLRVAASLDNSDRTAMGLDINDLVQGEVGVEVTVARDARGERRVHLRADLVNAELMLESVFWRKPKGRPSVFEFDVAKGAGVHATELHNVRLDGENVAIEGWMGVGADHRVREFRFPQFSLNVLTSLDVRGKLRDDNIWDVTAKGARFDGKDLFQSFFDVNPLPPDKNAKVKPGIDLRADIDLVVGFHDSNLHKVRATLQKRANKLTALDARGQLDGGKNFAAVLKPEPGGPRLLKAEATDAGQMFKLVGFYADAVGGLMNLEVNLDGQGVAERTGTLWAIDFYVLGDPIGGPMGPPPEQQGRRKSAQVQRQRYDFQNLRAPFSVGHGQFVLHDTRIEGELLSATMRGKIDFRSRVLQVGGSFTLLSGINKLMSPVPLVGPIVTGPRGDGVIAMTYAIQGSLESPQLIVNPFSLFTPGITRELMQITPENPRVVPRKGAGAAGTGGARSSSSPATGPAGNEAWPNFKPGP